MDREYTRHRVGIFWFSLYLYAIVGLVHGGNYEITGFQEFQK